MRVGIASDHGGFDLKQELIGQLHGPAKRYSEYLEPEFDDHALPDICHTIDERVDIGVAVQRRRGQPQSLRDLLSSMPRVRCAV